MVQLACSEWIILFFCPRLPWCALSCLFICMWDPTACHPQTAVELVTGVPALQPQWAARRAPMPAPPCLPALRHQAMGGTRRFGLMPSILVVVMADVTPFFSLPMPVEEFNVTTSLLHSFSLVQSQLQCAWICCSSPEGQEASFDGSPVVL